MNKSPFFAKHGQIRGEKFFLPASSLLRRCGDMTFRKRTQKNNFLWVLIIFGCFLIPACSQKEVITPSPEFPEPPEWVRTGEAPQIAGAICAIGVAGPTYFRTDAVTSAEEQARGALAKSMAVKISSGMIHIQNEDGGVMDTQTVFEVSAYANEMVLEGSRIMEVWFDEPGWGFAKKPEYTYALACIDANTKP